MATRPIRAHLVALGVLVASPASAAPAFRVLDPSVPDYPNTVSVGGGVLGFMGLERQPTSVEASSWLVRYGFTPATPVTWEVSYQGAMDVTPPEGDDVDSVFATLVDVDLRVNVIPLVAAYPFVAAGVGYGVFERSTRVGEGSVDYTTLTVPLAVGMELLVEEMALETRVQYRPTWFDEDVRFTRTGGDTWAWTISVGARF